MKMDTQLDGISIASRSMEHVGYQSDDKSRFLGHIYGLVKIMEFARDGEETVAQLICTGKHLLGRLLPSLDKFSEHREDDRSPGKIICGDESLILNPGRKPVILKVVNNGDQPFRFSEDFNLRKPNGTRLNIDAGIAVRFEVKFQIVTTLISLLSLMPPRYHGPLCCIVVSSTYKFAFIDASPISWTPNTPNTLSIVFFENHGHSKSVKLVSIGGNKVITGGNGIADGPLSETNCKAAMEAVCRRGFGTRKRKMQGLSFFIDVIYLSLYVSNSTFQKNGDFLPEVSINFPVKVLPRKTLIVLSPVITREEYANKYGPTTGDKIRFGGTDLFAEIENDFALYGDECAFGGDKVLRDGMGQPCGHSPAMSLDIVITNAVIIDYSGIIKADIGIKDGLISSIGKAGNPDTMVGVFYNMIIGANTEVIAGEGLIVTARAIDVHVHYICPHLVYEAILSGITTSVGGGTGPTAETCPTTCTPAPTRMKLKLQSTDDLPLNFGFTGKSKPDELHEIIRAGAMGLKLHEDWGSTLVAIDSCLTIAEQCDIQA
ncbi:hypothetical protein RJT34_03774 [Clitoria ternatea]|uniref:urease n=1 Tax=Clitoria ternatea TaxID=43366 RepID=A0AAN9KKE2_CLITE